MGLDSSTRRPTAVTILSMTWRYWPSSVKARSVPSMTPRRTLAQGDLAISETELTYADGSRYLGVSVMEFRDGLISKETDTFAEPFVAPQWRAQWVERM